MSHARISDFKITVLRRCPTVYCSSKLASLAVLVQPGYHGGKRLPAFYSCACRQIYDSMSVRTPRRQRAACHCCWVRERLSNVEPSTAYVLHFTQTITLEGTALARSAHALAPPGRYTYEQPRQRRSIPRTWAGDAPPEAPTIIGRGFAGRGARRDVGRGHAIAPTPASILPTRNPSRGC